MKKIISLSAAVCMLAVAMFGLVGCTQPTDAYDFTVGVIAGSHIDAFSLGRQGFETRLTELMTNAGYTVQFLYENAGGQPALGSTIASNFAARQVDMLFSMGTGVSQAALPIATAAEIPLVYGIITDPVGANLVTDASTGSSSALPMDTQISLLEELLGAPLSADNRVAFLYTMDEANSVASLARLRAAAPENTIVDFGIPRYELGQLTQQFINIVADPTIRAIYVPQDNQLVEPPAVQMIQNLNRMQSPEHRLPIVAADLPLVELGTLASFSVDFADNGAAAADIAFDILVNGVWPDTFFVHTAETLRLYVNLSEAEAIGFDLPAELVARADQTF